MYVVLRRLFYAINTVVVYIPYYNNGMETVHFFMPPTSLLQCNSGTSEKDVISEETANSNMTIERL
jgi:hypothetical protein